MTTAQKRGGLLLLAILLAIAGWRWRVATLEANREMPEVVESELAETNSPADSTQTTRPEKGEEPRKWNRPRAQVHVDLNTADAAELQAVRGIGPVLSERIVKYRNLIGGFQEVDQLKKVYGIGEEEYAGIAPQVFASPLPVAEQVEDKVPPAEKFFPSEDSLSRAFPKNETVATAPLMVDINRADSAELVAVPGIGPLTARNILKYRKLIYFFQHPDQLGEVWGIRPENKERMLPHLIFDRKQDELPHILINEEDKDGLARHKYLGFKEAGILVAYREQHGKFSGPDDLSKVLGVKPETLKKIEPYLQF